MLTIFKYQIVRNAKINLALSVGAKVLKFDAQGEGLWIWVVVDTDSPTEARRFHLAGTGHPLPEEQLEYVGSCFDGPFVWHLFEVSESKEAP